MQKHEYILKYISWTLYFLTLLFCVLGPKLLGEKPTRENTNNPVSKIECDLKVSARVSTLSKWFLKEIEYLKKN